MRYVVPVMVALLFLAACGANTEEIAKLQEGQRKVEAKLAALEKKVNQVARRPAAPARQQPDPNKVYNIPVGDSPFKGPADATVVMVEFSDYQCPFCARAEGLVHEVLTAYPEKVKFVYKEFPLSIHRYAMSASRAAKAAQKQGKFWEMHDKLFANQRALDDESLKKYATEIGLDVPQFEKDMASPEIQKQITQDMQLARQVGVRGTPTMFLNGKRVVNRTVPGIKQMIDDSLQQKKS